MEILTLARSWVHNIYNMQRRYRFGPEANRNFEIVFISKYLSQRKDIKPHSSTVMLIDSYLIALQAKYLPMVNVSGVGDDSKESSVLGVYHSLRKHIYEIYMVDICVMQKH